MKKPITKSQLKVFMQIKIFIDKYNYSPTLKDISEYFGFTIPTAQYYVNKLIKSGYLKRKKFKQNLTYK